MDIATLTRLLQKALEQNREAAEKMMYSDALDAAPVALILNGRIDAYAWVLRAIDGDTGVLEADGIITTNKPQQWRE